MNDFELELKLKSVRVPERGEEYWTDFPSRVRFQLGRSVPVGQPHRQGNSRLGWNGSLAMACVLLIVLLVPIVHAALKDERGLRRDAARLNEKMRYLMTDSHGMQNLITDGE
jgi:hypothetical protein